MPGINKPLLRLARALQSQLAAAGSRSRLVDLPISSWQRCGELVGQIRRAELRGWRLAATRLMGDLRHTVPSVESALAALRRDLPPTTAIHTTTRTTDVYRDLIALSDEFDEVAFDLRDRWLSVTTEPLKLEGIYLGPFQIQLDWSRIPAGERPSYYVLAKDPHPAESRENVTHPHVMDEILCEGDGRQAIRQALAQGRLLDFFTLVAGVLRNYNAESPFVELALWYGRTCSDCGAVIHDDECYVCERCDESVCERCEISCCGCDTCGCASCIATCSVCDDNYCRSCLRPCKRCRGDVCSGCLHENERCIKCHEEDQESIDAHSSPAPTRAAVQPYGLGQALASA